MKQNFASRFIVLSAIAMLMMVFAVSCKDDDSAIGTGIMPNGDMMDFLCDTMSIQTFAVRDTHVETHNRTINPIGVINDPFFGQTTASCAFQVLLSTTNVQFSREIDTTDLSGVKLTLQLKYANLYGDANSAMTINVNRLLTDISYDSIYYEDKEFATTEFEPLVSTGVSFGTDSIMKIEMPAEFVEQVVKENVGQETWSNRDFVTFFKGLYITTELSSGDGCIYALDLINSK